MKNHLRTTILHASVLLIVLLMSLDVQSQDIDCVPVIKVRRDTTYRASPGNPLRINCSVEFCNNTPPVMSWYYRVENASSTIINDSTHIHIKWEQETNSRGYFYLYFDNITKSNSGLYQCQGGSSTVSLSSHWITVYVSDSDEVTTVTLRDNTSSATEELSVHSESMGIKWQYVYLAAGMGLVVIVIIVSVLSMQRCKGKQMKKELTENQYMSIPMSHQPPPRPRIQPHPNLTPHESLPSRDPACTYDNALLRRASQPQTTSMETAIIHSTASGDHDHIYSNRKQAQRGKKTRGNDEEDSSLLYAALNHQIPGACVRPPRPTEETSEYAAIRVG